MNKLIIILFILFYSIQAYACDMCSCYMGITPYGNQSSIGVYYHYRAYNGYKSTASQGEMFPDGHLRIPVQNNDVDHHDGTSAVYSSADYEIYRTAELRGKFYIHERMELNAVIPYRINSQMMNEVVQKVDGIGDINLFAGYHLIRKDDEDDFQQRLIAGLGIKLPTGSYNEYSNGVRADAMIQPGTGTTDAFLYGNYYSGFKNSGINITGTYKVNGTNSLHEQNENSCTVNASLFYKINFDDDKFTIVPKANAFYEYTKGLYTYNEYVSGTASNVLMLGPAFDLFFKKLQLTASVVLPVYQKLETNSLANSGVINLGLVYNFNQTKYLFKKSNIDN